MSDSKKVIEIDKSSLVTLKAELYRLKKLEELKTRDHNPVKKINTSKIISSPVNSNVKAIEVDDSIELARSKRILEQKAKYYERMSKNKVNSTLILFENKKDDDIRKDETDYIEFTDCFGRTRKVEKSEYDKIRDDRDEIIEQPTEVDQNDAVEEIGDSFLKQREEWRKQEEMNKERGELHYQDILFDEARLHGTAWYKFSQDHQERKIQQENLVKMREKTEQAQSQRTELKKHRDDIIKNRIKLAKERMRNKLGLPVEQTDNDDKVAADDKSNDDRQKANEKAENDAEKELQREMERKRHIRPWDKGKLTGTEQSDESDEERWVPKKEKFAMSQDEWNEKQRLQRVNEFAPIYDHKPSSSKYKERSNPANNLEQSVAANLRFIREKFDKKN